MVESLRIESHVRAFKVTFHFLPQDRYSDDKLLSPKQILRYMETRCVQSPCSPTQKKASQEQKP